MLKCWFSCETSRLFDFELDKIVIVDSGLYAKKSRNWTLFLPRRALLLFAAQYCLHSQGVICSIFKKFWVVIDCQNYVFYTFWLRKESRKKDLFQEDWIFHVSLGCQESSNDSYLKQTGFCCLRAQTATYKISLFWADTAHRSTYLNRNSFLRN